MTTIDCESRIERVVLYARGAVVTRRVSLPAALPEGPVELCVPRVTALAEAGSLRALVEGEREIVALRPQLVVPAGVTRPGRVYVAIREQRFARERLEAERSQLMAFRQTIAAATLDPRLSRWSCRPGAGDRFGDALALAELLSEELARLDRRQQELADAIEENQRAMAALELEAAQGTTAEIAGEQRAHLSILLRLGAARGELGALRIEYVVGAARWWPAYTARFSAAATRVAFTLEAFVAQASGEDWSGVDLSVSTADLAQDARLPEMRALRFGRAQPPARKGYRPPPIGLEAMFEGHDRALLGGATVTPTDIGALLSATLEQEKSAGRQGAAPPPPPMFGGAPPPPSAAAPGGFGGPPPMPGPAMYQPQPAMSRTQAGVVPPLARRPAAAPKSAPMESDAFVATRAGSVRHRAEAAYDAPYGGDGGGGVEAPALEAIDVLEPGEAFLDFDGLALAEPGDRARRGRLVPGDRSAGRAQASAARAQIEALRGPPEALDPLESRGRFDHRHDAEGKADVPSNGQLHRVSIASAEAPAKPRFVTVPREICEVYREAEIQNPFAAPLLSGPVEVFFDGALLTTTGLRFVDRKGVLHLGLGVEDRLRVARNVRVEEGSAGLLGGSTTVEHNVTIELASSLGQKVTVEVLDRVPLSDEKDIEVKVLRSAPEASPYAQAERGQPLRRGLRWAVELPPGEKQRVELVYRLTLPSKNEIIGGNRRE